MIDLTAQFKQDIIMHRKMLDSLEAGKFRVWEYSPDKHLTDCKESTLVLIAQVKDTISMMQALVDGNDA